MRLQHKSRLLLKNGHFWMAKRMSRINKAKDAVDYHFFVGIADICIMLVTHFAYKKQGWRYGVPLVEESSGEE